MTEWVVEVYSMIPQGQLEERLCIFRVDRMGQTVGVVQPPTIVDQSIHAGVPMDTHAFMSARPGWAGLKSEIDEFLQAMMETGWTRGLRPSKFDPSAGELVAIKAHLDDMRRLANIQEDSPQNAAIEKKW